MAVSYDQNWVEIQFITSIKRILWFSRIISLINLEKLHRFDSLRGNCWLKTFVSTEEQNFVTSTDFVSGIRLDFKPNNFEPPREADRRFPKIGEKLICWFELKLCQIIFQNTRRTVLESSLIPNIFWRQQHVVQVWVWSRLSEDFFSLELKIPFQTLESNAKFKSK